MPKLCFQLSNGYYQHLTSNSRRHSKWSQTVQSAQTWTLSTTPTCRRIHRSRRRPRTSSRRLRWASALAWQLGRCGRRHCRSVSRTIWAWVATATGCCRCVTSCWRAEISLSEKDFQDELFYFILEPFSADLDNNVLYRLTSTSTTQLTAKRLSQKRLSLLLSVPMW